MHYQDYESTWTSTTDNAAATPDTDWAISEQGIYFNANLVFVLALADATGWVPAF